MRAIFCATCVALTLSGGQQRPSDVYDSAIAKYVAGDSETAFETLGRVSQEDIRYNLELYLIAVRRNGLSEGVRRRLEAGAMLHTDYALAPGRNEQEVQFHIQMADRSLDISRSTLIPHTPYTNEENLRRAREFLPRWYALAASALLTYYEDRNATTLLHEGLTFLPEDQTLLFWRGLAMEFTAVWVGLRSVGSDAVLPVIRSKNASGVDLLEITRTWGPVEEAYRQLLQKAPNHFEAHLHRGYALYSLQKYRDATFEYELARDQSTDPFVVYVADLLLARLKEDQNDLKGAAQDYEHALEKMPGAQNAYIGLGSIEERLGNRQRARELTERLATMPEKERVRDPWWAFHTIRVPADVLEWLRAAVRQ